MKREFTVTMLTGIAMIALATTLFATPPPADGSTQISGVATYAAQGACNDPEGAGASYVLSMAGDLVGCHYVTVAVSQCRPGRAYYEAGTEIFVGSYNGGTGSFETTYVFTAAYRDCPAFIGEIAGRCQHPITDGTGTGVFDRVRGRIDMKDDVVAGNFPYRGHFLYPDSPNLARGRSLDDPLNLVNLSSAGVGGC